jgi:hypothetical protein
MLEPPDTLNTIGVLLSGITEVLSTPRVSINESAKFNNGPMVSLGFSSLSVGPKK